MHVVVGATPIAIPTEFSLRLTRLGLGRVRFFFEDARSENGSLWLVRGSEIQEGGVVESRRRLLGEIVWPAYQNRPSRMWWLTSSCWGHRLAALLRIACRRHGEAVLPLDWHKEPNDL